MKLRPAGKIALLLIVFGVVWIVWKYAGPASMKKSLDGIPVLGPVLGSGGSGGAGGGGGGAVLDRPLRVALNYWPGFAGGVLANNGFKANQDCDYWNKHHLQVEFVDIEDPDQMGKGLTKGAPEGVDAMWQTTDTWPSTDANLRKAGVNAKTFLQADWSQGGDAMVATSDVRRIEDLPGKRIGLITLTPSHSLLEEGMRDSSLDDAQRRQIEKSLKSFTDPAAIVQAFTAGQLDVAITWEPNVSQALKRPGAHVLLSSATASKMIGDIFVAKEEFIKAHPEAIKAFCEGWLDGATAANARPSDAVKVLMASMPPYKDAGEQVTQDTLGKVRIATLSDNNELFGLDGKTQPLFDRLYDRFARVWFDLGAIPSVPSAASGRDTTALAQIYAANPVPSPSAPVFKPATPPQQAKPAVITKRVTINFATGSTQIAPQSAATLRELTSMAERLSDAYLRIEGNTDNVGSREGNIRLSRARAQAVADHLAAQGFDRNRFIVAGNGPDKPIASNGSAAGRAANRRTDVQVVPR